MLITISLEMQFYVKVEKIIYY